MKFVTALILISIISAVSASAEKFSGKYYLRGCHVFSSTGSLAKTLPGNFCIPLPDGKVLSGSLNAIRLLGSDSEVIWEVPVFLHHQMNLSPDGKRILALGSELTQENGARVRFDEFMVISMDGKVLARNTIRVLGKDFFDHPIDPTFAEVFRNATKERTHFNSIFEIGPLKNSTHPAIKEGNIIVNGLFSGIYILSPDLKTVLFHELLPGSNGHHVHDVKVLPNGNLFLFNNDVKNSGKNWPMSALQEVDPVTMKPVYSYSGENGIPIFSSHCGGVQKLDEEYYLISHMVNGSYIFSRKTGKVVQSIFGPYFQLGKLWAIQNLRQIELSDTFKKVWDL